MRKRRVAKKGGNKKVKNATKVNYDGITFRSKLELYMYKQLQDNKFKFDYEKHKFVLVDRFVFGTTKIREITYLPDFMVYHKDKTYIVETKGLITDSFTLKLKLFKKYLVEHNLDYTYLMPRNQQQCRDVIEFLNKV